MALPHRDDYDRGAEAAAVGSSGPDLLRRHWHHSSPPRAGRNENAEEIVQIRRNMPPGLHDERDGLAHDGHRHDPIGEPHARTWPLQALHGEERRGRPGPRRAADGSEDALVIRVHYEDLYPEDVTEIDGIPVTTPARTLLDLATVTDDRELEDAVANALRRGLTHRSEILEVIARYPHHRGGRRLRALIDALSSHRTP